MYRLQLCGRFCLVYEVCFEYFLDNGSSFFVICCLITEFCRQQWLGTENYRLRFGSCVKKLVWTSVLGVIDRTFACLLGVATGSVPRTRAV